ncbi:hypothetical protein B0J11DRAFT_271421 [Dendryphion nanum]|uniref:Zn(2)-C6 fungal-type domain-containing protein n=1 Tax=Dendryphion nanum TaxID=256645 RepID=A0A9P9E049_9PLEO|nr:hypothetical protein B0J11DRAFT_271421 [Dendryphion nanum]
MVGVPGRSKGCKTCRRRKKGCDLKVPECGQCTERGFTCGGYDRDRIFINQNAVRSTKLVSTETLETIFETLNPAYPKSQIGLFQLRQRSNTQPATFDIVLPQSLACSAFTERVSELYLDAYLPSDESNKALMIKQGLPSILPLLTIRHDALKTTLVAVYAAVTGLTHGDKVLTEEGKRMYGKGLQGFNRALRNGSIADDDALLAVPRFMGLFEVLFGAGIDVHQQGRSWQAHTAGEVALMEARGPAAFNEGIPHLLFIEGRLAPIISAVALRKATILDSEEWKTLPWKNHTKSAKDSLLDILASTPEILERIDMIRITPPYDCEEKITTLRTKCWNIEIELEAWLAMNPNTILLTEDDVPMTVDYSNMVSAHLTVIYCTICILLYSTIVGLDTMKSTPLSGFLLPDRQLSKKHPRQYARQIARSAPYFFNPSAGIWGATMIAFPMGIALMTLQGVDPEANWPYVEMIYEAWRNPKLPTAIQAFLVSIREECQRRVSVALAQKIMNANMNSPQ